MEIQIQKDFSLHQKLSAISSLLQFTTSKLSQEENKLIRENLFYEKFLNKQLKAKKPVSHNYMKTNQERKQQQQPEKQSISQMPEEVFENHIQENILNVIQKAQIALSEINDDPKPKFQKPAVSPYEQGQLKPSTTKPPTKMGTATRFGGQGPPVKEEKPVKKPLPKVILHKQSSMQTTYNSAFTNKPSSSNRSSSNIRSDPTAPTQSSAARKSSVNQKNNTSFGNPLFQAQQQMQVYQSQNSKKTAQNPPLPPQNTEKTTQKNVIQPPTAPTATTQKANFHHQSQQKQQISQKEKEQPTSESASTSSTQASFSKGQNQSMQSVQNNDKEGKDQPPSQAQSQKQVSDKLAQLATFQDGSDLFESIDKNDLEIFYGSKKKLLKSQKEYQQQTKYYKEKETKARGKFLNKLTSHFNERHLVTEGKLIRYENSKNQDNNGKQKQNLKKVKDKYNEDEGQEEEKNEFFDPFYEYYFIDQNSNEGDSRSFNLINQLNQTMLALQEYTCIMLSNINLNSQSEEIVFLNSIKNNKEILKEDQDLLLLFRVWYFIQNLENNYAIFKKINFDTISQINQVSKQLSSNFFSPFIHSSFDQSEGQVFSNENENEIMMIQFQIQERDCIRYLESSVQNKFDHYLIHEINKQSMKMIILQIIEKYIVQVLQESLLNNIHSPKINLKLLQSHLKIIRSISGIVEYSGKLVPAFFLTDSIQDYFEGITE